MTELTQSRWFPIALLSVANVLMTFALYRHLRHKSKPLLTAVAFTSLPRQESWQPPA